MIAWAVVRNPELVERRMQELRTVLERTALGVVVPIVVVHTAVAVDHTVVAAVAQVDHMVAVEAAHTVVAQVDHMAAVAVAVPIVVVHKVVEVARMAAVVVDSNLVAAAGLDHKT